MSCTKLLGKCDIAKISTGGWGTRFSFDDFRAENHGDGISPKSRSEHCLLFFCLYVCLSQISSQSKEGNKTRVEIYKK